MVLLAILHHAVLHEPFLIGSEVQATGLLGVSPGKEGLISSERVPEVLEL